MHAEFVVVDHFDCAVTDQHGSYELNNMPPGEYVRTAWHEGWKIAREETVIVVDSHQEVHRLIFREPKTWDANVIVRSFSCTWKQTGILQERYLPRALTLGPGFLDMGRIRIWRN